MPDSPIPTRVVSNGEYLPKPKSGKQVQVDALLADEADRHSRALGMSRRAFLGSACGMATAMLVMNRVYGHGYFQVSEAEAADPQAAREALPKEPFIFDVQTHHVDVDGEWIKRNPAAVRFLSRMRPQGGLQALSQKNFIKEIFLDSETTIGILSGVPAAERAQNFLPVESMAQTRDLVNDLAGSQRMLSHGLVAPNLGQPALDDMERQVKQLKVCAWKLYPGADLGRNAWWLDDEKVAYPLFQRSLQLGIRNICIHKGLPLGIFQEQFCHPTDLKRPVTDFPRANFIIYHSAFPWHEELIEVRKAVPNARNLYAELGSTFAQNVISSPEQTAHILGSLLKAFGSDHLIWGTDSIWWGTPQWQITAFRRFRIPDELIDKHGYPQLTDEDKRRILGLNAARLWGIDPAEKRFRVAKDRLAQLRDEYVEDPAPSLRPYGPTSADEVYRLAESE